MSSSNISEVADKSNTLDKYETVLCAFIRDVKVGAGSAQDESSIWAFDEGNGFVSEAAKQPGRLAWFSQKRSADIQENVMDSVFDDRWDRLPFPLAC